MYPDTATVTETGPGGQQYPAPTFGWGAVLVDGTPVRVFLTAKVRTTKIPVLDLGQVIRVLRFPSDLPQCSVSPTEFEFVSPSKLARRIENQG